LDSGHDRFIILSSREAPGVGLLALKATLLGYPISGFG
jgi:hypothetical protein